MAVVTAPAKGLVSSDLQIGQTGKTIRPRLYYRDRISDATQHRIGVEGADLMGAIHTDKSPKEFRLNVHWPSCILH